MFLNNIHDMSDIINILHKGNYSCVIENGGEIYTYTQRGVMDLYDLLTKSPEILHGARLADKVIGKAAASLVVLGGVKELYAELISEPALSVIKEGGIKYEYMNLVSLIQNRDRSGICPLELMCKEASSPEEALALIEDFVIKIRAKQ